MIPDHLLLNTEVYANRHILLRNMKMMFGSERPNPFIAAEIGVAYGSFSRLILEVFEPDQFHAFDIFTFHEEECIFGAHPSTVLGEMTHQEYYEHHFPQAITFLGHSQVRLADIADHTYDFVYVDGDHLYEGVKGDIEQLKRVVKPGGIIMFDDYCTYDIIAREDFGVLQAVNEYIEEGHEVLGISLHPEGFHNIAVRA